MRELIIFFIAFFITVILELTTYAILPTYEGVVGILFNLFILVLSIPYFLISWFIASKTIPKSRNLQDEYQQY